MLRDVETKPQRRREQLEQRFGVRSCVPGDRVGKCGGVAGAVTKRAARIDRNLQRQHEEPSLKRGELTPWKVVDELLLRDHRLEEHRVDLEFGRQCRQASRTGSSAQDACLSARRSERIEHRVGQQLGRAGERRDLKADPRHRRWQLQPTPMTFGPALRSRQPRPNRSQVDAAHDADCQAAHPAHVGRTASNRVLCRKFEST